ncbi:MAG: trehalose-phosphatase, partial [Polyangiaceae bacterium]|nr:trehalose-phosphatase [Polyangiaceae bacterium]
GDFRPFDVELDYLEYVDGKPRHDGVTSFLRSRGIDLPVGGPDDAPDAETVFALGKRKQAYFVAWLRESSVRTYPGTLRLIHALRALGVRTAVFSSSRNTEEVLRNAGALDLFEAKVDGNDLATLGIPGKPHPAMLLEAASRLGVAPERAAVLEDAVSGVEAGARGGFALVVGVDRGDHAGALTRAGAHIVVRDPAELCVDEARALRVKTLENLPSVWEREEEIRARLSGKAPVVFLDYDGTLTPIVEDHQKAVLTDGMRRAIATLAKHCTVSIVSGRGLDVLMRLVDLDSVYFAGSHGFEIRGPGGSMKATERGLEFLPKLDEAEARLRERLAGVPGHAVERKRFS